MQDGLDTADRLRRRRQGVPRGPARLRTVTLPAGNTGSGRRWGGNGAMGIKKAPLESEAQKWEKPPGRVYLICCSSGSIGLCTPCR